MPWTTWMLLALAAAATFIAGHVIASWFAGVAREQLERGGVDPSVRRLVVTALRPLVVAIGAIAALGYLGTDTSGLVVVLGALALTLGLAVRGPLANLAAGGMLLSMRPYREGDIIHVAGVEGKVIEQSLHGTTVLQEDGVAVTIPSDRVVAHDIRNLTRLGRRRLEIEMDVARDTELDATIERLANALVLDGRVLEDPPPRVLVAGFDAGTVRLVARAWTAGLDVEETQSALRRAVLREVSIAPRMRPDAHEDL